MLRTTSPGVGATGAPDGDPIAADEFGVTTATTAYGWLGGKQRRTDPTSGLLLMGVRLYNPTLGRFLQTDPVYGGNATTYGYPQDPINLIDLEGANNRRLDGDGGPGITGGFSPGGPGGFPIQLLRQGFSEVAIDRAIARGSVLRARWKLSFRYGGRPSGWGKYSSRSYTSASGNYKYEAHWYEHSTKQGVIRELKIKGYYRSNGHWREL